MASVHFPEKLNLAQLPTPLQPLDRLSAVLGGPRIWIKRDDLTGSAETGNKIRKLEFTLARAKAEGADTLITCGGVQSNHCRATALLGARLGLEVHLVLRGDEPDQADANLLLDQLAGAQLHFHPAEDYHRNLSDLLMSLQANLRKLRKNPWIIPTGASDGIGVWGYVGCCAELMDDFTNRGIHPAHIICATGSGGTQAGLSLGNTLFSLGAKVTGMAVCDSAQWFLNKVRGDIREWAEEYAPEFEVNAVPIHVDDRFIGPGYAQATAEVLQTIAMLARLEGVVLDPVYTGKAFHGMLKSLEAGQYGTSGDVVFIHTGGIYGLFPYREQLVSIL